MNKERLSKIKFAFETKLAKDFEKVWDTIMEQKRNQLDERISEKEKELTSDHIQNSKKFVQQIQEDFNKRSDSMVVLAMENESKKFEFVFGSKLKKLKEKAQKKAQEYVDKNMKEWKEKATQLKEKTISTIKKAGQDALDKAKKTLNEKTDGLVQNVLEKTEKLKFQFRQSKLDKKAFKKEVSSLRKKLAMDLNNMYKDTSDALKKQIKFKFSDEKDWCIKKFCKENKKWKRCYHDTARTAHPDKGGDEETFKALNACNEYVNLKQQQEKGQQITQKDLFNAQNDVKLFMNQNENNEERKREMEEKRKREMEEKKKREMEEKKKEDEIRRKTREDIKRRENERFKERERKRNSGKPMCSDMKTDETCNREKHCRWDRNICYPKRLYEQKHSLRHSIMGNLPGGLSEKVKGNIENYEKLYIKKNGERKLDSMYNSGQIEKMFSWMNHQVRQIPVRRIGQMTIRLSEQAITTLYTICRYLIEKMLTHGYYLSVYGFNKLNEFIAMCLERLNQVPEAQREDDHDNVINDLLIIQEQSRNEEVINKIKNAYSENKGLELRREDLKVFDFITRDTIDAIEFFNENDTNIILINPYDTSNPLISIHEAYLKYIKSNYECRRLRTDFKELHKDVDETYKYSQVETGNGIQILIRIDPQNSTGDYFGKLKPCRIFVLRQVKKPNYLISDEVFNSMKIGQEYDLTSSNHCQTRNVYNAYRLEPVPVGRQICNVSNQNGVRRPVPQITGRSRLRSRRSRQTGREEHRPQTGPYRSRRSETEPRPETGRRVTRSSKQDIKRNLRRSMRIRRKPDRYSNENKMQLNYCSKYNKKECDQHKDKCEYITGDGCVVKKR